MTMIWMTTRFSCVFKWFAELHSVMGRAVVNPPGFLYPFHMDAVKQVEPKSNC